MSRCIQVAQVIVPLSLLVVAALVAVAPVEAENKQQLPEVATDVAVGPEAAVLEDWEFTRQRQSRTDRFL
ncbi:hypothetical protein [Rhodopirellula sallentina]|nr:hypothetical protein [Rhodopirellula sallentina]